MIGVLKDTTICGIASAVPTQIEENIAAAKILGERRCKKQIKLTGVARRHISPHGQKMSDLCFVAAAQLLDHLGWNPKEIKVLVLLTQHPDYMIPSTAFLLQKMLHIPQDAIVFDVNLGCSAFNVGVHVVSALLQQFSDGAKGICMQGDLAFQSIVDGVPADELAGTLLFGSAGSAVAIEKKVGIGIIPVATFSDGTRYDAILRNRGESLKMLGETVFNFSTNDVADSIRYFMEQQYIRNEDIDFYVFHQAQKLILDSLAAECNIPEGKELRSLAEYGNTSGASVPLSLCANRGCFAEKDSVRVLSCGFGVGLSWSIAYTRLKVEHILPVIFSDSIFEH